MSRDFGTPASGISVRRCFADNQKGPLLVMQTPRLALRHLTDRDRHLTDPSNHALYLSYPLRRGLSLKPIQRTFHPAATAVDDVRVDHRGRHILVSQ